MSPPRRTVVVVGIVAAVVAIAAGVVAGVLSTRPRRPPSRPPIPTTTTTTRTPTTTTSRVPATTTTAPPPTTACVAPVRTWSASRLASQLVMALGSFDAMSTLTPEAAAGIGALDFLGDPAAGSGPSIAAQIATLSSQATAAGQVVPWMSTTEEGGTVTRLAAVIGAMPAARQLATEPTTAIESIAARQGAAMHALGLTMNLAPVLDTAPPTQTAAAENTRSFSDTGHVAGADGVAFARGMRSSGEVPVVKHFPGLGHASANTDTGPATVPPLATLEKNDLVAFQTAIAAGLPAVMVGNQVVPGLTGGQPASLSPAAYTFLRRTLGFTGLTVTDSLGAGGIAAAGDDQAAAAVAAVGAGADMAMVDAATWPSVHAALTQAIATGQLGATVVDAAVSSDLAAKHVSICATG